jgi:hypothetical protein
VKYIFE